MLLAGQIGVGIPAGKYVSLLEIAQTSFGAHPTSQSLGTLVVARG